MLFILPSQNGEWKEMEKKIRTELPDIDEVLSKAFGERIGKAYFFKDFELYKSKYWFTCLGNENKGMKAEARALQRYPSEVKDDALFIGNMTNVWDKGGQL